MTRTVSTTKSVSTKSKLGFIYPVFAFIPLLFAIIALATPRWFVLPSASMFMGGFGFGMMNPFIGLGPFGGLLNFLEIGLFYMCLSDGSLAYGMCLPIVDNSPGFMRCFGWCERLQAAQALGIIGGIFLLFALVCAGILAAKPSRGLQFGAIGMSFLGGLFMIICAGLMFDIRNRQLAFMMGPAMMGLPVWVVGYSLVLALLSGILGILFAPVYMIAPKVNKVVVQKMSQRKAGFGSNSKLIRSESESLTSADEAQEEVIITDNEVKVVRQNRH